MIITISGLPGAGKTSVGKHLAKKLNYKFYSMGDLRGEIAIKKGITINQLNKLGENESWTDTDVDNYQKELGNTKDNIIIEGRLSFHFIPNSIKIFLTVDPTVGATRIFKTKRKDEEQTKTIEELKKQIQQRIESDKIRYQKYYQINSYDTKHYDQIIDTTNISIKQATEQILEKIKTKHHN